MARTKTPPAKGNRVNKLLATAALAASVFAAAPALAQDEGDVVATNPGVERETDRAIGESDAPLVMVEYASVACPHCAHWYEENWAMVSDEFIDTGEVRFILREMLTGEPRLAMAGFLTARCADPDLYFDAIHLLFEEQRAIFEAARDGGPREQYVQIGAALGLNEDALNTCFRNEELQLAVIAEHEAAMADGVNGTPSFFFNGVLVDSGAAPDGQGYVWYADGEPLLIDDEVIPTNGGADSFRRIILHFLNQAGD